MVKEAKQMAKEAKAELVTEPVLGKHQLDENSIRKKPTIDKIAKTDKEAPVDLIPSKSYLGKRTKRGPGNEIKRYKLADEKKKPELKLDTSFKRFPVKTPKGKERKGDEAIPIVRPKRRKNQ